MLCMNATMTWLYRTKNYTTKSSTLFGVRVACRGRPRRPTWHLAACHRGPVLTAAARCGIPRDPAWDAAAAEQHPLPTTILQKTKSVLDYSSYDRTITGCSSPCCCVSRQVAAQRRAAAFRGVSLRVAPCRTSTTSRHLLSTLR